MDISFACPVTRVKLSIGSEILDSAGAFTKFIISTVAEDYSVSKIDTIIDLGETIIEEELEYLKIIGFVKPKDLPDNAGFENIQNTNNYDLTEKGKDFYKLLSAVENFNETEKQVFIEHISGQIVDTKPISADCKNLPKIEMQSYIQKKLFYNKNYANSKEIVLDCLSDEELSDEKKESIYTILEFNIAENDFFCFSISEEDLKNYHNTRNENKMIVFERDLFKIEYTLSDERLVNYRNVIDTLFKINKFDYELLSQKAIDLLECYENEQNKNKNVKPVYYDNFTGELLSGNNFAPPYGDAKLRVILPEITDFAPFSVEQIVESLVIPESFRIELKNSNKLTVYQEVPFKLFLENIKNQ